MASSGLPTTSLSTSVMTCAGAASRARPPPLTVSRCLRTTLISLIVAPLRSSASVVCCRSSSEMSSAGRVSSAEPPPEIDAHHQVALVGLFEQLDDRPRRLARPPRPAPDGWLRECAPRGSAPTGRSGTVTLPSTGTASPSTSSTAAAIGADALPAPTTSTRRSSTERVATGRPRASPSASTLSARRTAWPGSTAARAARRTLSSSGLTRGHVDRFAARQRRCRRARSTTESGWKSRSITSAAIRQLRPMLQAGRNARALADDA